MLICPSMLSADPIRLGEELIKVEQAEADVVHWDVMDGSFVDVITFGDHVIAAHRKLSHLRFDVHLMVENPERHLERFARAGADTIIVHSEACKHLHKVLGEIKSLGKRSGVALNPATSIDCLEYCLMDIDMVVVMGVNPGSSGRTFIQSQLKKIAKLKEILPDNIEICVDGGITDVTIGPCRQAGANSFVSGSYIFKNEDYSLAIKNLRNNCVR